MLYKLTEWQDVCGKWHCGCVDDLANGSNMWYLPARILNISPAQYISWVIDNYAPDDIYASKEKCLVFISWTDQNKMRKFKNYINKKAREINFQI